MAIVKASWLNVLLIFIPAGWAVHFAHVDATVVFVLKSVREARCPDVRQARKSER